MPVTLHTASADDQFAITMIVRAAWLYPRNLDWQRFLLARWGQDIIGVGQVKPHFDGSRELASLAVVPEWQGNGVGGALIRALLSREPGPLHLMCDQSREQYYERFGFKRIGRGTMTPYFRRFMLVAPALRLLSLNRLRLIVMWREAQ